MHLNRFKRIQFCAKKKQKRKETKKGKKNSKELFEINSKMVVPVLIGVVHILHRQILRPLPPSS